MADGISNVGTRRRTLDDAIEDIQHGGPGVEASRGESLTRAHDAAGTFADLGGGSMLFLTEAKASKANALVHPERAFTSRGPLQSEVLRLRAELAKTTDPALRGCLSMRLQQLSNQWCAMARAEGLEPPKASFDPAHATDRELANAVLWTEIGHSFPLGTMTHPIDPDRFRADVLREQLIRSPDVLRAYVGEHVDDPKVMPLLREALVRAGDKTPCRADETPRVLLQRLSMLRPSQSAPLQKANADDKQLYMGLDGRVGTKEQLDAYELGEYVKAMQSETSFGSIAAGVTAVKGGSVEDMRRAGEAGDFLQRLGSLGGGEENVEGKKWPPAVVHGH